MEQIVTKAIISEKSFDLAKKGWFTFQVSLNSTKKSIATAVSQLFKVHVIKVRTLLVPGKSKRVGKKRQPVSQPDWKKALVKLKPNEKIALFATDTVTTQVKKTT